MLVRALLALDSKGLRTRVRRMLDEIEVDSEEQPSGGNLEKSLNSRDFDLLVLGGGYAPETPEDLSSLLVKLVRRPEVIVLRDREDPKDRARLLASGALAVLWEGLSEAALGAALHALVDRLRDSLLRQIKAERPEERYSLADFVSDSPAMQHFLRVSKRVVHTDTPLLVLGETGVGKERLARAIHAESGRSAGPFIAVNCGALPENLLESELFGHEEGAFTGANKLRRGYFELAHRGTIFLDEVGDMPLHLQVKLLRVLEDHRVQRLGSERSVDVDVRVVAATNRDLKSEMEAGRFRSDLYYRLAVVALTVPPLRERREDIPVLAESYLAHFRSHMRRRVMTIHPEVREALLRYPWPGNVRELINVMERAVLLCSDTEIRLEDLPKEVSGSDWPAQAGLAEADALAWPGGLLKLPLTESRKHLVSHFERRYLVELLRSTQGRVGEAAERAQLSERALYNLMKRHGLRKEEFRDHGRPPRKTPSDSSTRSGRARHTPGRSGHSNP